MTMISSRFPCKRVQTWCWRVHQPWQVCRRETSQASWPRSNQSPSSRRRLRPSRGSRTCTGTSCRSPGGGDYGGQCKRKVNEGYDGDQVTSSITGQAIALGFWWTLSNRGSNQPSVASMWESRKVSTFNWGECNSKKCIQFWWKLQT